MPPLYETKDLGFPDILLVIHYKSFVMYLASSLYLYVRGIVLPPLTIQELVPKGVVVRDGPDFPFAFAPPAPNLSGSCVLGQASICRSGHSGEGYRRNRLTLARALRVNIPLLMLICGLIPNLYRAQRSSIHRPRDVEGVWSCEPVAAQGSRFMDCMPTENKPKICTTDSKERRTQQRKPH